MSAEPANRVSRAAERGFEPARPARARLLERADLAHGEMSYELGGRLWRKRRLRYLQHRLA